MGRRATIGARWVTPAALAGILLAGGVVRVVYWYGVVNVDPFAYGDAAASLARGLPVFDPALLGNLYYTQYLRLSLIVPAAAIYAAAGPGEVQSTLFPIACSLGMGVVAFGLARLVNNDRFAGLVAAALTVFFPIAISNSTQFLPDTVLAFFSSLTVLLFWAGVREPRASHRRRAALFASAGACWALAFYGRQTAVGLALPLAVLFLVYWPPDWRVAWGAAGAGLVALGLTVVLVAGGGEPFEDIRTVVAEGRGHQPGALGYSDIDFSYASTFIHDRLFLPLTALTLAGMGFIALNWSSTRRGERRGLIALGLASLALYLYFEHLMRLPSLYSWWKEPRYVLPLVPMASAIAGVGLAHFVRMAGAGSTWFARGYACLAVAFFAAFALEDVDRDHAYWEEHRVGGPAQELARFLSSQPETVVYFWDDDLARYTSLYAGLERTTFYERSNGRGYLQNRFAGPSGASRVGSGSLVVTSAGQAVWPKPTLPAEHWTRVWDHPAGITVWRAPAQPGEVPSTPVEIALGAGISVTAAGVSPVRAAPAEHIRVTLKVRTPAASELVAGTACAGRPPVFSRTLSLPPGESTVAFELAASPESSPAAQRCEVVAGLDPARALPLASFEVTGVTWIEPEALFSHDRGLEEQRGSGWVRVDQPFFSGGGAAVALGDWRPLALPIPVLPPGDYWVTVTAYAYPSGGANRLSLSLNGQTQTVSWEAMEQAGLVRRSAAFPANPGGASLGLEVVERGQDGVTIDSVVITSSPPRDVLP